MADVATQTPTKAAKSSVPKVTKTGGPTPKNLKPMAPSAIDDDVESQPTHNGTHETNGHDEEYESGTNGEVQSTINGEEDEDEGEEAQQAGSVDADGNVVDEEGNIIGHVNGETASQFHGSVVDQEGDVLDHEGNIIAKAELKSEIGDAKSEVESKSNGAHSAVGEHLDGAKSEVSEKAKDDFSVKSGDKPALTAPFGVQDNGEVTNDKGVVVGKLTEGEPTELVGQSVKEIDEEGNLKGESGSVLGKASIDLEKPEVDGEPKLDEEGKPIDDLKEGTEEKLGEDGKPIDDLKEGTEEKLGEDGKPIDDLKESAEEKLGEDGKPIEEPKLDEEGKPIEEPKLDADGKPIEDLKEGAEEKLGEDGKPIEEPKLDEEGNPIEELKDGAEEKLGEDGKPIEEPKLDEEGNPIEELKDGAEQKLGEDGKPIEEPKLDEEGNPIEEPKLDKDGNPIEDVKDAAEEKLDKDGKPIEEPKLDEAGNPIEEPKLDADGNPIEEAKDAAEESAPVDLSILKGKKVNKAGKIVDENGNPFGQLVEGEVKKLVGKKVDGEGNIWDDSGKIIGKAELLPENDREAEPSSPFEDFPDSIVDAKGNVIFEGKVVGKLIEGDAKKLEGKKVDADGDVLDKNGNVLGKAERYQESDPEPEAEPEVEDISILEGKKVNKAGNVVDDNGKLFGRLIKGDKAKLVGKKCDKDGKIWSESGKVIGEVELLSLDDRDEGSDSPFEDFPGAIVDKNGNILYEGQVVGKLVSGDAKKLVGKHIDKDGEVVDKIGNVLGKAERWIEEDAPAPEKVDNSALAGKRVNKVGNVVDSHGSIFGRLVEGDPKKLAGRMCDKNGNVLSEDGNVIGRAELVSEGEREGEKEGPFAGFSSPTVAKDGKVADSKGVIIGRLIEGDAKKLYGKEVDADGDVLDRNGNTLGKAERWEEEEKEKVHSPVAGRKVNKEGNVVDENGDLIAKLTEGTALKCAGKEIDEDGDVYNSKGQVIGHVSLIEDIPEPEPVVDEGPKETPEEIEEKKKIAADRKLAGQIATCVQQSIDKVGPILKMITEEIDAAERKPKEELDEQKLVDTVRPLIEQGNSILVETNGAIRALDPDGRISSNAKAKASSREATPEEAHLAEMLKELSTTVTGTIENAKKKIAGMPHAKKELNPLWGLLAEPLGQILAAVGLLLAGVLGLVGKLLSGLGLGGLLDNLLGGLGLKGILKGLGLGMVTESLTGKK